MATTSPIPFLDGLCGIRPDTSTRSAASCWELASRPIGYAVHSMEFAFIGGTAGPSECFTCHVVSVADEVLSMF